MTRSEHIRALLAEYAARRTQNSLDLRAREEDAFARDPALLTLRAQAVETAMSAMRAVLQENDEAARTRIANEMRKKGTEINAQTRARLRQLGLPEDSFEENYRCEKCKDTGYIGTAPARFCECFEKALAQRMLDEYKTVGILAETFENFLPEIIPEENGQRRLSLRAKEICENFAAQYPNCPQKTLILTGPGGLGKTFLLNAIYAKVTEDGKCALRMTAFQMFEAMRRQHIGNDPEFEGFRSMTQAPLLLIDDLGSEPMMRNITVEYFFTLVNERMVEGHSTVIATNLSPLQIQERYGERVFSRLFDRSRGIFLKLDGKDLRAR